MTKPLMDIQRGTGRITFRSHEHNLRVVADRYDDEGFSYLYVYSGNGSDEKLLLPTKGNLLATTTASGIIKRLERTSPDMPWEDILTFVSAKVLEIAREGEPLVLIGKRPETTKVEYQLRPILERNQPTTIYGPGGYAKSYLAAYIACLVQFGVSGVYDWQPQQGGVLYCDYESSPRDHERRAWAIKAGLRMRTEDTFLYLFCTQPLVSDIHRLQRLVEEKDISLVIIDSQMAAAGHGPDPSQVSSQYYNALRSLRCTTLTLDHVSKQEWGKLPDADSTGPYGSVVKTNRSRSQFEIRRSQAAGDDFMEIALVHRKHNEGKLLRPIGVRVDFVNDVDGDLEKVTFSACDISDNPELSKVHTLKDRLSAILAAGPRSVKELSDELEKPEGTVRATLNRHKGVFVNNGDEWELKAYEA